MIEIFLLVSALCVDEMVASMAYGADGIKLGIRQILLMNLVCSSFLGVSLGAGTLFSGLIQEQTARAVGFVCLLFLGLVKLFDYHSNSSAADKDESRTLSIKETFFLSCAMSIDSLAVGVMAAFLSVNLVAAVLMTFVVGCVLGFVGYQIGSCAVRRKKRDLSWLCGVLLIILALMKL